MLPTPLPGQGPAPGPMAGPAPAPATQVKDEMQSDVAAISVTSRIPEFWADHPRLWFLQTEAVLAQQKLSDEARYNVVITKLSKADIQQVTDILMLPPESKKFDALKERLLAIYEESETRQVQKLIGEMELGEQKPSQLLRRMRDLARSRVPDDTLKILWQGHLPAAVRGIIAVTDTSELDVLARIADKVMETAVPAGVAEIKSVASAAHSTSPTDLIINEIRKINNRIDNLQKTSAWQAGNARPSRSRGRSQARSTTPAADTAAKSRRPDWKCFYHFRYGARAHKCVPPCSWKSGN